MDKNIARHLVHLTNPEKILFEKLKISKKMLAEYYFSIQDWILPHIINRPITIVRCPSGTTKPCFYQKHPGENISQDIFYVDYEKTADAKPYLYIKNIDGLIALVQLSAVELHIWNCTIHDLAHPDQMILDLDPDKNFVFSQIVEGAKLINTFLKTLKLKSFLKTTGRKGLNIVIPLAQKNSGAEVFEYARSIAIYMSNKYPDLFVANPRKTERHGRIYLDYLRNHPSATFIAPFSTRATEAVGIATPISWKELATIKSGDHYNFNNIQARLNKLKSDPWQNLFKLKQSMTKKLL